MNRRSTPEADAQRAIVQALRVALPRDAIIHHCANEVTEAGSRGQIRQSILVGMGVHAGFADQMARRVGRVRAMARAGCHPCQRKRRSGKRQWPTTKWIGSGARSTAGASRS